MDDVSRAQERMQDIDDKIVEYDKLLDIVGSNPAWNNIIRTIQEEVDLVEINLCDKDNKADREWNAGFICGATLFFKIRSSLVAELEALREGLKNDSSLQQLA